MLTKLDKLIILLIIIAAIASAPLAISASVSSKASSLTVFRQGKKIAAYDLQEPKKVKIAGPSGGYCLLMISGGQASIAKSTCPLKICQKQGRINKPGQAIVCAPMQLLFQVSGQEDNGLDAVND